MGPNSSVTEPINGAQTSSFLPPRSCRFLYQTCLKEKLALRKQFPFEHRGHTKTSTETEWTCRLLHKALQGFWDMFFLFYPSIDSEVSPWRVRLQPAEDKNFVMSLMPSELFHRSFNIYHRKSRKMSSMTH